MDCTWSHCQVSSEWAGSTTISNITSALSSSDFRCRNFGRWSGSPLQTHTTISYSFYSCKIPNLPTPFWFQIERERERIPLRCSVASVREKRNKRGENTSSKDYNLLLNTLSFSLYLFSNSERCHSFLQGEATFWESEKKERDKRGTKEKLKGD